MISYTSTLEGVSARQLRGGVFEGWADPPSPETHLRLLARLGHLYAVDLLCDPERLTFYASLGMRPATGMMVRRYANQSGTNPDGAIY